MTGMTVTHLTGALPELSRITTAGVVNWPSGVLLPRSLPMKREVIILTCSVLPFIGHTDGRW